MKKVISLILAVAVIASMFILAVPASAADAKITLSASSITVTGNGDYTLKATVSGVPTYESWIGIYNREDAKVALDANLTYKDVGGHYGWFYTQAGVTKENTAGLKAVKDGTVVDISSNKKISATKGAMTPGEYVVVMFKDDGLNDDSGFEAVATANLTVTASTWISTTYRGAFLGSLDGNTKIGEGGLHFNCDDAVSTTWFDALDSFDKIAITAWEKGGSKWLFEIIDEAEDVIWSEETTLSESVMKTFSFKAIPAGHYGLRVSPGTGCTPVPDQNYIVLPVATPYLDARWSETILGEMWENSGILTEGGPGAALLNDYRDGKEGAVETTVCFSYHTTGAPVTPGIGGGDNGDDNNGGTNPAPTDAPTQAPTDAPATDVPATSDVIATDDATATEDATATDEATTTEDATATDEATATEDATATEGTQATAGTDDKKDDNKKDDEDKGGLSGGAIAAIIVAAVVVLGGAGVAVYMLVIKKKA